MFQRVQWKYVSQETFRSKAVPIIRYIYKWGEKIQSHDTAVSHTWRRTYALRTTHTYPNCLPCAVISRKTTELTNQSSHGPMLKSQPISKKYSTLGQKFEITTVSKYTWTGIAKSKESPCKTWGIINKTITTTLMKSTV